MRNKSIKFFIIFFSIFSLGFQIFNNNLIEYSTEIINHDRIPLLADVSQTRQWIETDETNLEKKRIKNKK